MRLLSFLSLLFFVGCATRGPQHQVAIGNAHPQMSVRDVMVMVDGRVAREFSQIGGQKIAALRPRRGTVPEEITVTWTDPDGRPRRETLRPTIPPTERFRGQILLEIQADQVVSLWQIESTEADPSPLPWATPETWEGTIGIPGLDER